MGVGIYKYLYYYGDDFFFVLIFSEGFFFFICLEKYIIIRCYKIIIFF